MTEKVKLPKEVCDALNVVKELTPTWSNAGIIVQTCKKGWLSEELKILNDQDADVIASALVLGYEPERTSEELLKDYYLSRNRPDDDYDNGYRRGVYHALKFHGIQYDWMDE